MCIRDRWSAKALAELGAFVDVVGDIVDLVGDAIEALLLSLIHI